MVKINLELEKIILLVFFAIMLYLGPGVLFDHKISHDFPFAYGASDAFQHQIRAEWIKDAGDFKYEAPYISKGFEDAIGRYPPVIYHLAVILSYAAGIETYDSIYFLAAFFAVIASFIMYLVIRSFSKTVALLSLPLSILIFSHPPAVGFLWGHWPSLLSQAFLILFFWSMTGFNGKKSFILIAISLSAMIMTHMPPFIFAFLFLVIFLIIKLSFKKISVNDLKNVFFALIIAFAISAYYLIIFLNTWAKAQPFEFIVQPIWDGNPGFYIAGFGLLLIPMLFGIISCALKLKELCIPIILAFTMLIAGFMNYAGFEVRSFQIRFLWPIYLSVFFGFGIYIILKFIIKKWNIGFTSVIFVVLILLLIGAIKLPIMASTEYQAIPYVPQLNRETSQGMMNPFHWQALEWLSENTPSDANVYFFYGDIYSQDALLRNSKRLHYQVSPEDFIKALQEREIRKEYVSELPGDSGGTIATRTGLFAFASLTDAKPKDFYFGQKDICDFDYFVFDKVSRQEVLAQYNLLIASKMLEKGAEAVFENDVVAILKNNAEDDCIEEGSF